MSWPLPSFAMIFGMSAAVCFMSVINTPAAPTRCASRTLWTNVQSPRSTNIMNGGRFNLMSLMSTSVNIVHNFMLCLGGTLTGKINDPSSIRRLKCGPNIAGRCSIEWFFDKCVGIWMLKYDEWFRWNAYVASTNCCCCCCCGCTTTNTTAIIIIDNIVVKLDDVRAVFVIIFWFGLVNLTDRRVDLTACFLSFWIGNFVDDLLSLLFRGKKERYGWMYTFGMTTTTFG